MKFFVERIDSNLSVWNLRSNTLDEQQSIVLEIKPSSHFSVIIDDNYVLCSDEHYTTHNAELMHRKKINCSATILCSKHVNQEPASVTSLGYGKLVDEDLNFFIHLNSQIFLHLCNQINSMKKINDLFITFNQQPEVGSCIQSNSENSENSNKLVWNRTQAGIDSLLDVKSLEFGCNLYQTQDSN
jgi:hypothetical protein